MSLVVGVIDFGSRVTRSIDFVGLLDRIQDVRQHEHGYVVRDVAPRVSHSGEELLASRVERMDHEDVGEADQACEYFLCLPRS